MHTMEATVSELSDSAIVCMPETAVPGLDGGATSDSEGMSSGKLATRDHIETVGGETSREDAVTIRRCDPAGRVGEAHDTFKGRGERRHGYETDSCTRDKKGVIESEVDPLGNNEPDRANTDCLNSGPTDAMDSTRSNWVKTIEVRFQVADVN